MALPQSIYRAFLDPDAWVSWLPPRGMTGRMHAFDPRAGGFYRMTLTHDDSDHAAPGKSSEHSDTVEGRFVELVQDERIVQIDEFQSDDPAFAGAMTTTWSLTGAPAGTKVTILCENVPEGIRREDRDAGLRSTLANLSAHTEGHEGSVRLP